MYDLRIESRIIGNGGLDGNESYEDSKSLGAPLWPRRERRPDMEMGAWRARPGRDHGERTREESGEFTNQQTSGFLRVKTEVRQHRYGKWRQATSRGFS